MKPANRTNQPLLLYNGWSLVFSPNSFEAIHLLTLLECKPEGCQITLVLPGKTIHSLPTWVDTIELPVLETETMKLWWEQWRFPRIAKKAGASLIHLTSTAIPLWGAIPVIVSPICLSAHLLPSANPNNYDHLHINVLKTYASMFPDVILGLSDHTHAVAPVVAAVTLGARVIERHFTDSNDREGPDHKFAMDPAKWSRMVEETRLLERSLGSSDKFIADNERNTSIVQRRCLRAARDIQAGEVFTRDMIDVLRPATIGAIKPDQIENVIGTKALHDFKYGQELRWTGLGE